MSSHHHHPFRLIWQQIHKQKRPRNDITSSPIIGQFATTIATICANETTSYHRQFVSNAQHRQQRLGTLLTTSCHHHFHRNYPHRSQKLAQTNMRHYGSRTIIELEEQSLPGMELIQPYMRSALNSNPTHYPTSSEFVITFLGTGGGSPTRHRLGSCTALRLGGQTFLFDVTEGALRQLEFSRIMIGSITKIFITHLHGDHVFGLVPVILGIMVSHKVTMSNPTKKVKHQREHNGVPTLEIYGPPGLYNYIAMVLSLSCSKVNYLNIHVIELVGGKNERGPPRLTRGRSGGGVLRNIFLSHYPEIDIPLISRKYLEQNEDNIWVIDAPAQISPETLAAAKLPHSTNDGFHRLPNDFNLGIGRRLHIKAAEVDHIYGVQTFGYTIEEQPPPGNIDLNKAIALGVKPSKKYGLLKCGLSVPNDEGTDVVRPEQVLNKMYRPRKLALLADHRLVYRPMAQLCKDADLLVHEATLSKEDGLEKIKMRGHNNAFNAGAFGKEMGCKAIALNHFGSASSGKDYVTSMVSEAREGNRNASQIIATYDFLEVSIPRGGFDFNNATIREQVEVNDSAIADEDEVKEGAADDCDEDIEVNNG
ncbi:hypothetical protein ACHAWU_010129 [Discostella pseudostelligera]|uniref:Uncharacterized protein n=1 Tax=Discostella pseudostelligera TaxID=259834 RepID=A0ABD3MEC8_9STRA